MTSMLLRMQHTSLQFSDTPGQQEHDVRKLFEEGQHCPIKTGTEAGPVGGGLNNRELVLEYAEQYGHAVNFAGDAWVAVDRKIAVPKSIRKKDVFLISNDHMKTAGTDRIMPTISFEHVRSGVGILNVGSVHYPTKGAEPGSPNHMVNRACAQGIASWMREVASGADLAFVNGDFNMNDRTLDFALGHDFTSLADKLKAWENTGHGPIDGFCKYDKDHRVGAYRFIVLNDNQIQLFSDHFLCRGIWEIRLLKEA